MNSKIFTVKFQGAPDTRWHENGAQLAVALEDYLHSFGRVMTRGAIPCVTVEEIFPVAPLTAERPGPASLKSAPGRQNDQSGVGAVAPALPTSTTERRETNFWTCPSCGCVNPKEFSKCYNCEEEVVW